MTTPLGQPAALPTAARDDIEAIMRAIARDGLAFIPEVLDRATVAEARRRIDSLEHLANDTDAARGAAVEDFSCVFNRDPYWLQFIDQAGIIDAIERLMGPDCHIIGMSALRTPPAGPEPDGSAVDRAGGLHADQILIPLDEDLLTSGRVQLPWFLGTLHFYLSDIDIDLCPTWVVPGSHLAGRGPTRNPLPPGHHATVHGPERTWNGRAQVPVLCGAGDCLLFRSELWHRGSRNRSRDRCRHVLQVHYGQRGMAQRFAPYLRWRYDETVLAAANPRQLRLIGKHEPSAYG